MKIKIILYAVCIFLITLFQSTVLDYVRIYHVKPNLLIVFTVCIALLRGNKEGAVVGFITGLFQDMISGRVIGCYALLGLYLGLIIGSVNKRLYRENFLVVIFFTFISSIIYESLVCLLGIYTQVSVDLLYAFKNIILIEAVYNSIISIVVYVITIILDDKFEGVESAQRKY